ncbi:MAG: insulinase family protein [Acholeplasmatales bacterium]|nr:insulinase family protein [Acholeplasmatales bacterium]
MKNYTKISEQYIDEIDARFTTYLHNKTKAKVATIETDDDNKVFSIAFRTPPIDNTGLTHILEHSVLCGSEKYPLKDPFVELLKSSLNTFLNAMTFPDKTMYPIASKNLKDFKNLMDVYLDAVFHPNIYKHKEIFLQEGWHYHLENRNDELIYNGVVYNEMKGAFSDPEEILGRVIKKSLFPDTAYGYESGGDPKSIPNLSYESFLDFHSKYYSASNSYIYIYGDCDMEERLEYLDRKYLSKMDYVEFDTSLKYQDPFRLPKYKTEYYSSNDDNSFLSYNVVIPTTLDNKLIIALDILVSSLFNVTGAPIKEAIIKNNLGDDVDVSFDVDLLEPILSIVVRGANSSDEERFIELVDSELEKLIKNGFDKKSILSIINHEEFIAREKSFSPRTPKGLLISMASLSTWLYDDNNPCGKLLNIKYYSELKKDLENGYFEELAYKYILKNNHKSYIKLNPIKDYDLKEKEELKNKLRKYKDSLSDDELLKLVKDTNDLSLYQSTPDSMESILSIPKLSLEDIDPLPEKYNLDIIDDKYKILYSNYHTNGISYVKYYFNLDNINVNDFLYLNLYASMLTELSTMNYSYYELNERIRNDLGGISFGVISNKDNLGNVMISFVINSSFVDVNIDCFYDLLDEIINKTVFNDSKRLYEVISELRSNIENEVAGKGHVVSLTRAAANFDYSAYLSDLSGGIGYIDFIRNVYDNFDNLKNDIIDRFNGYNKLFCKNNMIAGYTGSILDEFKKYSDKFFASLNDSVNYEKMEFNGINKNEAIMTPFNINFVSRCGKYDTDLGKNVGYFEVLQNILRMDYLWDRIRVHGGAYGAMMRVSNDGIIGFTSYRDPNIDSTDNVYNEVCDYIDSLSLNDDDLLKYKIGTFGNNQLVLHNKDKAEIARSMYLKKLSYEERCKNRKEILECSSDDLKNLSKYFREALDNSSLCVIGSKDKIEESKIVFDNKRKL